MSRTPSMTPQEAESILGPRGSLRVTPENRPTARKWLTAIGLPALFVGGLSKFELAAAYNSDDGLRRIKDKLAQVPADEQDESPIKPNGEPPMNDQDARTLELLRSLFASKQAAEIDESRVRSIVDEMLAGKASRVIEIHHEDREPIKIEGYVHPDFERALKYLQRGANVMLVGPAGCGKSHMAKQLAQALDVQFGMISGSAGASESELKGWLLPVDGGRFEYCASEFVQLYEGGNALWCFDEIDGFDPNMLMVANVPLANGHFYVQQRRENPTVKRGQNVYFLATANTFGTGANPIYCGRNPMDEATRDRFIFIHVDYDKRLEENIGSAGGLTEAEMAGIWELRDRCRENGLRRVISTRAFQKAAIMKQSGDSWREIRDRLLEGWSKDEKAKVGV